jgi:hypothetical protein
MRTVKLHLGLRTGRVDFAEIWGIWVFDQEKFIGNLKKISAPHFHGVSSIYSGVSVSKSIYFVSRCIVSAHFWCIYVFGIEKTIGVVAFALGAP